MSNNINGDMNIMSNPDRSSDNRTSPKKELRKPHESTQARLSYGPGLLCFYTVYTAIVPMRFHLIEVYVYVTQEFILYSGWCRIKFGHITCFSFLKI